MATKKQLKAIEEIHRQSNKTIADMREALRVRGAFGTPHGIGWGLGSEGDYLMTFHIIPTVNKQRDQCIANYLESIDA